MTYRFRSKVAAAGNIAFGDDPPLSYIDPALSAAQRAVIRTIEIATGQRKLKAVYDRFRADGGTPEIFWSDILRRTGITPDFDRLALANIPPTGPLLVVANHPFGLVDGLLLCWLISQVRTDFKLLINSVLIQAPETKAHFLPISFASGKDAQATNLASRAAARQQLDNGGAVLVFPAGGISTSPDRWGKRPAMDAPWQPFIAQMLQRAKCPLLPIYFHGQNGRLFHMISHVSSTMRLALMAGEIRRRFGTRIRMEIGEMVPFAELADITDRTQLATELCRRTYALGGVDSTLPGAIVDWPKALQVKEKR